MHSTEYSQSWGPDYLYQPISRKSRLVTFLLAFFLGMFGAHRFYVGKTGTAIAQLGLSLTVIGVLVSSPWVFIDWILIISGSFRDGEGRKITRWDN
ncbi:TM2 domain-containing membrane protein YozV [Nitrobacter vulgaris]|uniref:TM2 domain-containing protein n=1 Tax=Nitrobacter vulgaris TaxID=29421 RepID=UPI0028563A33|nr:TM2 domain-containing protein [Nitrobacter vulgaris]MDR6305885.1 TM2 domain-containing membrane protein YozV [Nitrobacter vulgaris]